MSYIIMSVLFEMFWFLKNPEWEIQFWNFQARVLKYLAIGKTLLFLSFQIQRLLTEGSECLA